MRLPIWETVKDSDDPADLQLYLDQFPDGIFAALAKRFIARLETSRQKSQQAKQTSVELAQAEERRKLAEQARLDAALKAARARHANELSAARREAKEAQKALEDARHKQATAKKADDKAREESRLAEKATNETKLEVVASVATPASPGSTSAATPFAATRAIIKEAQERLYELNYDVGEIDGLMGNQTRQTILAFEADARITQNNGRLTQATLKALRKAGSLAPWAAIAYSKKTDSWGASWKHTTRKAATAAAIKSVRSGELRHAL